MGEVLPDTGLEIAASIDSFENLKNWSFSQHMTFISCRIELRVMLAGATSVITWGGKVGWVSVDVYSGVSLDWRTS